MNSEANELGYGYFRDGGMEETIEYDLSFDESYVYVPSRESPYVIIGEDVGGLGIDGDENNTESSD